MTDLIARIAARAVGTPAVAQPRLPTFFGGEAAALEVADEHVAVPPPSRDEAPQPAERHAASRRGVDVEVRTIETASAERLVPAPSRPPHRETVLSSVERTIREREIAPSPSPPLPMAPDPAVAAQPAITVQATPVVLQAAAHATAAAAPAARVDEPPPVRVHIGRLDVRANLQQAPPPQPRREPPRPQGLTLADYLRGKREAG